MLTVFGLGSCVALAAYDPVVKAGALAHVLLPGDQQVGKSSDSCVYADFAVGVLIRRLRQLGAIPARLECKLAGGARTVGALGTEDAIGPRNVAAVLAALERRGISPRGKDTGGGHHRSLRLFVGCGRVLVQSFGLADVEL